jgi:hypothetical protein
MTRDARLCADALGRCDVVESIRQALDSLEGART